MKELIDAIRNQHNTVVEKELQNYDTGTLAGFVRQGSVMPIGRELLEDTVMNPVLGGWNFRVTTTFETKDGFVLVTTKIDYPAGKAK